MTWPTLAFPSTGLGQKAATPVVITLVNNGAAAVPVASVTDSDTTEFPWTTTCSVGASLAAGSACAVTAQFTPGALGARTATVTIDANGSTQTFTLTGTGVAPVNPQASIAPADGTASSTVFTFSVAGLTAGGQATLYTNYKPATGAPPQTFPAMTWTADGNGNLSVLSMPDAPGAYENWVVDSSSGVASNHVTHTVE